MEYIWLIDTAIKSCEYIFLHSEAKILIGYKDTWLKYDWIMNKNMFFDIFCFPDRNQNFSKEITIYF